MKHTATQALVTIAIAAAIVVAVKVIQARAQQRIWAMQNYGRFHDLSGGLMPNATPGRQLRAAACNPTC
jgi:hypothetical protein